MPISNLDKLHFSFCQDLGDKASFDAEWPIKLDFSLFTTKQTIDGGGGIDVFDDEKLFIPGFYEVRKVGRNFWNNPFEEEVHAFIAPDVYYNDRELFYEFQDQLIIPIPNEIFQHPHLPTHSTFQFYFLNNSLFTANLPYLDIGDFEGNGSQQMRVHWAIKANPAGTYVFFRSGHIFFKWKIEVRQSIVNMSLMKVAYDSVNNLMKGVFKAGSSFLGIDASGVDKASDKMTKTVVGKDKGKDFMKREKDQKTQEQHTARMFTSTLQHTGDNPIEPSIFYANTVKFPYNLFDYWLRTEKKAFICRFYYSNNLLNNLIHNNNENPITYPLNITFEKLGNILKPGFYQGKLTLDHDPDGRMTKCFDRGVTFYEDKKKHFVKPNLGVREAINHIQYSSFCHGQNYTAQAIQDRQEQIHETNYNYDPKNKAYSHGTYITLDNSACMSSWQSWGSGNGCKHWDDNLGWCWGCTHRSLTGGQDETGLTTWQKEMGTIIVPNDCNCVLALETGGQTHQQRLEGGKEYTVIMTDHKVIFKYVEITTRIEWQKQPGHDDFDNLDWTPPAGSGGETEIPLSDPEVNIPEPGENDPAPEPDFTPDPFDPTGGEPEIPTIEPDIPPDIDPGRDPDIPPDIDPPPIEPDPPEIDPNDPDTGQDPDPRDPDPGEIDPGGDDDDDD